MIVDPQQTPRVRSRLKSGSESRLDIVPPVPVHIDYRTAFFVAKAGMNYRDDIYGRDALVAAAMSKAALDSAALDE